MRRLSRHFKRNDGGNGKIIPSAANYSAPMDEVPGNPVVRLGASFANRAARLSVFAVPSISRRKCCIAAKRRFRSAPRARSPCASVCSVFSTEGRVGARPFCPLSERWRCLLFRGHRSLSTDGRAHHRNDLYERECRFSKSDHRARYATSRKAAGGWPTGANSGLDCPRCRCPLPF